jgi:hypothetical protein
MAYGKPSAQMGKLWLQEAWTRVITFGIWTHNPGLNTHASVLDALQK